MLKNLKQNVYHITNLLIFLILVIFALSIQFFLYKMSMITAIFPSIEIILIYYFYNKQEQTKAWLIMLLTIFLDQMNNTTLGISIISIIIANLTLNNFQNWLNKKNNLQADYLLFACYLLLIWSLKYCLLHYQERFINNTEFVFQYVTTVLSYPLLKLILDKLPNFLSYNAKTDSN